MKALLEMMERMIAVIRSVGVSGGAFLATTVNVTLLGTLTWFGMCAGPVRPAGNAATGAGRFVARSAKEWWEHANESPIVAIVILLAFVTTYAHSQRIFAACIDVLTETVNEAASANSALAASFDRLLDALRRLLRIKGKDGK